VILLEHVSERERQHKPNCDCLWQVSCLVNRDKEQHKLNSTPHDKLTLVQLLRNYLPFLGIWTFNTVRIKARNWSLIQATWTQSTSHFSSTNLSISCHLWTWSYKMSLPVRFPNQNSVLTSGLSYVLYMPCLYQLPWLYHHTIFYILLPLLPTSTHTDFTAYLRYFIGRLGQVSYTYVTPFFLKKKKKLKAF
jgi:hypothetical protein